MLAASPGLSDQRSERYQKLSPYLLYELPPSLRTGQVALEDAPVCLAFLKGDTRRILVHKQYTGADALGRQGTYVTHLLAGLPQAFSAREAILLWHAQATNLWITGRTALKPQILEPIAFSRLRELQSQAWGSFSLAHEPPALRQTLALFLQERPPRRVYLCGQTGTIALMIWCITHSLPAQMLKDLTFTTYEDNVAYAGEKIVGLSPHQSVPPLPQGSFYVDLAASSSSLPVNISALLDSYLTFALQHLATRSQSGAGPTDRLTEFLALVDSQAIDQPAALLQLFEQSQARFLPQPEASSPQPAQIPLPPPPRHVQGKTGAPVPVRSDPLKQERAARLPAALPGRTAFLRISLALNVLLVLAVAGLLLSHGSGNPGIATQTPQQAQMTATVLSGNDVSLSLVGVSTYPDPVKPGEILNVSIIIQNQGPAIWTPRQGFYLACVPAGTNGHDPDCQAILPPGIQKDEPGTSVDPPPLMASIPLPERLAVSPSGYYFFTFRLTAQLIHADFKVETHSIVLRIGQGSRLLAGSIKVYFLVCKDPAHC